MVNKLIWSILVHCVNSGIREPNLIDQINLLTNFHIYSIPGVVEDGGAAGETPVLRGGHLRPPVQAQPPRHRGGAAVCGIELC